MRLAAEDVLLSDQRVARIEGLMRMRYPDFPKEGRLFTYIQPSLKDVDMPRGAVFCVSSPDPKGRAMESVTRGVMRFDQWKQLTWAHERLVGVPDPAIGAFDGVVKEHIAGIKRIKDNN